MTGARMVRIALPILAVALVVAAGTRGAGILLPAADLGYYDERMIRIAALAVAAAGLVVLVIQRRRGSAGEADSPARAFAVAAIIMWGLFAVSLPFYRGAAPDEEEKAEEDLLMTGRRGLNVGPAGEVPELPGSTDEGDPDQGDGAGSGFDLSDLLAPLRLALPILLLAFAVLLVLRAQRRTGRVQAEAEPPGPEEDQPSGIDGMQARLSALLELAGDPGTPRHRIFISYARLLEALGSLGASRLAYEAPHEHLERVLGRLPVRREPVHRLAELFVMARFGARAPKESDGTAAAHALELSLDDLRRVGQASAGRRARVAAMGQVR